MSTKYGTSFGLTFLKEFFFSRNEKNIQISKKFTTFFILSIWLLDHWDSWIDTITNFHLDLCSHIASAVPIIPVLYGKQNANHIAFIAIFKLINIHILFVGNWLPYCVAFISFGFVIDFVIDLMQLKRAKEHSIFTLMSLHSTLRLHQTHSHPYTSTRTHTNAATRMVSTFNYIDKLI